MAFSVVSGVVKDHKGWISVKSDPGNGSTFKIYLPVDHGEPANKTKKEAVQVDLTGKRKQVLVVEDDEDLLIFNIAALTRHNYIVYGAKSIKDATAIFNEKKEFIDLVFCDVILPDGNSFTMLEKFITQKQGFHVVMTSGYLDDKCKLDFIKNNGFKFIHKPYLLVDLLVALKNIDSDKSFNAVLK